MLTTFVFGEEVWHKAKSMFFDSNGQFFPGVMVYGSWCQPITVECPDELAVIVEELLNEAGLKFDKRQHL